MEHRLLLDFSSLCPTKLQEIFRAYNLDFGSIYLIEGKMLHCLCTSKQNEIHWPAATPFNHNYTTNFGARLPVGWVKQSSNLKLRNIWPKGVSFYFPLQNNFLKKLLFVVKPKNPRIKPNGLNVALEILGARIHSIVASQETRAFVSEVIFENCVSERLGNLKSSFINLSENVLASMRGTVDRLDEFIELVDIDQESEKKLFRITHELENYLAALNNCIQSNFGISSLEKQVEGEHIIISTICKDIHEELNDERPEVNIKIALPLEQDLSINGGKQLVKQAITEVVRNSVRYSARKEVYISAYTSGEYVVVDIEDDGPGVKEGLENIIFLKYYRGSTIKGLNNLALGWGLDFAKTVAKDHNGDLIHMRTVANKSLFRFMFPVRGKVSQVKSVS